MGHEGRKHVPPGHVEPGQRGLSTPSGKKLPDALRLLIIDPDKAKDQFHWRLKLAANDDARSLPGAAFLHSAVGEDYAAMILAEEKQINDKGREEWVNVHERPNYLFDADLLSCACAEMEFPGGGLRILAEYFKRESEAQAAAKQTAAPQVARSSWMND